jgi:protein SCO1/2
MNKLRSQKHALSSGHGGTILIVAALSSCLAAIPVNAMADGHAHMHHDHSRHVMPSESDGYQRTQVNFSIPDVSLVDSDGVPVPLVRELNGGKPVLLNFIFTSCGAICPVMSATFARVQDGLGPERDTVRMVSISIDPEQDTPAALKAYAGKYGAGPQWRMLTGSLKDSIAVQRAFDVYRGDKMNHVPQTFLRLNSDQSWVRIEGFANADDLLREYRLLASR